MQNANANHQGASLHQEQTPGSLGTNRSMPSIKTNGEPDWAAHFWHTLYSGLPATNLLANPYFPQSEQARGGWREIIERIFKPHRDKVDGITGRRGEYIVTPEEALNRYGSDTASRLLSEGPRYFTTHPSQTYFCFVEMSYSPVPDWAIVHRDGGPVLLNEDLLLCRPEEDITMMTTVVGPVFQLHLAEVRLWEAIGMRLHRAFLALEMQNDLTES